MDLSFLNPHIRYARCHYAHLENKTELSICYDCRLFFVENADGYVIANDVKYEVQNGTCIYLPPLTKYCFRFFDVNNENFKIIVMDFDLVSDFSHLKASLGTATEKTFSGEKVIEYPIPELLSAPIVKPLPHLAASLSKCTEKFLMQGSFYRESSSAQLKLCLLDLLRQNSPAGSYSALCESVINYIYENHKSQSLSNAVIAEAFNYHPYHLNHILKTETGKSLHKHLIGTRLNIAKNLLHTTSFSIEEISWKAGFTSASYFIRCFKEAVGLPPKKYRQMHFHTEL